MIRKEQAIISLRPNSRWVIRDDIIEWLDGTQRCPTEEEINAEIIRLEQDQPRKDRIIELKKLLSSTDYIALSDYDKDKSDIKLQRQLWREEIRLLELEAK